MKDWWKNSQGVTKHTKHDSAPQPMMNDMSQPPPPRRSRRVRKARHRKKKDTSRQQHHGNDGGQVEVIRQRQIEYRKAFMSRKRYYSEDIQGHGYESDEDSELSAPMGILKNSFGMGKTNKWRKGGSRGHNVDFVNVDPEVEDFVRNAIIHAQNGGRIALDKSRPGSLPPRKNNDIAGLGHPSGGRKKGRRKSWDDLNVPEKIEQLKMAARREAMIAQAKLSDAQDKQKMLHALEMNGNKELVEQALNRMMNKTKGNDAIFNRLNNLVLSEGEQNGRTRRNSLGEVFE